MIETLKAKIKQAQGEGDIAALYVLEQQAHDAFDEATLGAYYANILELAMENLTDALETARRFDMSDVQDFSTLRALYEYAIEHYSAGQLSDAAALFEILAGLSTDERFSDAMRRHREAAEGGIAFERFVDEIADLDATRRSGTFYFGEFR